MEDLEPLAVSLPTARRLLGEKSHSEIYEAIGRGALVALKDGRKILVTLESIRQYIAALPRANIKPPTPNRERRGWGARRLLQEIGAAATKQEADAVLQAFCNHRGIAASDLPEKLCERVTDLIREKFGGTNA